ncbi:MAG TPA: dihydrolipoamide acetyltransferase family protein [Candidatus Binataceae bacterium]|jgi:pyruvate dehydrogenase E2 component (dihydrolipoamide acetyltransferase)
MSNEIVMPKLSDTMEEGKILRWLKHPGDTIHQGEPIAEVETDKADMVLESFAEGILDQIKLKEGESAPVGAVIATMRGAGDATRPSAAAESVNGPSAETKSKPVEKKSAPIPIRPKTRKDLPAAPTPPPPSAADEDVSEEVHPAMSSRRSAAPTAIPMPPRAPTATLVDRVEPSPDGHKFRASPLARRAAEEAGIDLAAVHGTGPEGRITKRDIDNFLREQQLFRFRRIVSPREGAPGSHEDLSRMRKTIANRMAASKREIPHFYVTMEIDMAEAVKLKTSLAQAELIEEDITYNDIIVKALALALARYPRINASFENDGITIHPNINIGVAVAVEDGLVVPVIHACEQLSLIEIAGVAHRLVAKAGRGGFTAGELSGATFTISNMGMLGIEHFAAVIVPPQAAILAASAIKDRPVVRDGALAVGKTMMATMSCDHRIIDGVVAGRFLQELKRFLENPASLLL